MVKFFIEKRKDKKTKELVTINVPIFLDYSFNGKRLQYYTGCRIDADKWDDGLERTKEGKITRKRVHEGKAKRNVSGGADINDELNDIRTKFKNICDKAKHHKIQVTVEYIRNELSDNESKKRTPNVITAFEIFIKERKNKDAINTLKKYTSTYNHYTEYCKNRKNLEFQDLTLSVLEGFKSFLINEQEHTHNTVVKYCKTFKTFIIWAKDRNYNPCPDYEKFKIDAEKEPAIIFLNWKELMSLNNLKIENDALRQVRDVFCFGCFTGQRYSDYENLKPQHIVNNIWINSPIKSHESTPIYIPLTNYALDILKKYNNLQSGKALPIISNAKMNKSLKEMGKLAKLNAPVTIYRFIGNKRIEKNVKKYEVLTTHIMRKTFISNALSLGMQVETIKEFTGHSKNSNKDFTRYLAIINEDKIKAMNLFNKKRNEKKSRE